jgi:hypothetical protein
MDLGGGVLVQRICGEAVRPESLDYSAIMMAFEILLPELYSEAFMPVKQTRPRISPWEVEIRWTRTAIVARMWAKTTNKFSMAGEVR